MDYTRTMQFMVIERFKNGNTAPIGQRFADHGRLMPDGVEYVMSWVDPVELRCFQVMEARERALLDEWISHWNDLVDFEVVPVVTSAEFWQDR